VDAGWIGDCALPQQHTIVGWLVERISSHVKQPAEEIDVTTPFSAFALDSVDTVALTADLEDWLRLDLAPTLVWDYPSIAQLARYLSQKISGGPVGAAS
jgi:acyl carrier protein